MDSQQKFDCICQQKVDLQEIKYHIQNCSVYQENTPFYSIFKEVPLNNFGINQLKAIQCEFQIYMDHIEQQIQNHSKDEKIKNKDEIIQKQTKNDYIQDDINEIQQCLNCHEKFYYFQTDLFYYVQPCQHLICIKCLKRCILSDYYLYGQIQCLQKECQSLLQEFDYQILVGPEKYDKLQQDYEQTQLKSLLSTNQMVQCINCKGQFEFQIGQIDLNYKDDNKQLLSHDACVNFFENRFNCIQCKTEQCRNCQVTPYHKGFTCQEYEQNKQIKKCRFCLEIVCKDKECELRYQNICEKTLKCGHECFGFKNETQCPNCLICQNTQFDYCNICMIEGLSQAPIIQSNCGHQFHYHCVKKNLELKWFQPRITFGFLMCPLCKQQLEFKDSPLQILIQSSIQILNIIQNKAIQRLHHENRGNDEKLIKPESQFYQNPEKYAMAIYSYYMCFKCSSPYYGGLRDCERGIEENQQQEYKKEDLICPDCCPISVDSCQIKGHGKEYIQWKCKFCCSIAIWFCWGNTHFCDICHKKQCKGEYMNRKKKSELPQCQGGEQCPLKAPHKPNGEEFCLGCQLCISHKQNKSDF